MEQSQTEKLANRFAQLEKGGMKDVKFFMQNLDEADLESVCAEINAVYDSVDAGKVSNLRFNDSRRG